MRFFYAKKEQICQGCKQLIFYNDECVAIRWQPRGFPKAIPLVFHVSCYIDWETEKYNTKWKNWQIETPIRPERKRIKKRIGRPMKYTNPTQARRLKASIHYHRKQGNMAEVKKLEGMLEKLIRNTIVVEVGK